MALVLESVLVGQDRQHSLQPLIGKLHYSAATLANEVLMVAGRHHGLISFESFAKVVRAH
jgi:hypothetical protein